MCFSEVLINQNHCILIKIWRKLHIKLMNNKQESILLQELIMNFKLKDLIKTALNLINIRKWFLKPEGNNSHEPHF